MTCPPYWVATRSYTARCPGGKVGCSVTATRQGKSFISEPDAARLARLAAKHAAEEALKCYPENPDDPNLEINYPAGCNFVI